MQLTQQEQIVQADLLLFFSAKWESYSLFRAITGGRFAARKAGKKPATKPTQVAKTRLNTINSLG